MVEIFFPDVSHYQSGLRLQSGTPACLAKATEGTSYTDPSYQDFKAQAAGIGAVFGAYHWINGTNAQQQAALCHRVVGDTPVMWDVEAAGATVAQVLAVTKAHRALGGRAWGAYLPHWWWQNLGSPDLRPLAAAGLALVSSNYPAGGYTTNGPGWASYGGVSPVQWQYTSTQSYGGKPCDFNAFKGTQAQYRALLYGGAPTTEVTMTTAALVKDKAGRHYWSDQVTTVRPVGPGPRDEVNDFYRFMGRAGAQYAAEIRCKNFNGSHEPYGEPLDSPSYEDLIAMGLVDVSLSGAGGGLTQAEVDARIAAATIHPAP